MKTFLCFFLFLFLDLFVYLFLMLKKMIAEKLLNIIYRFTNLSFFIIEIFETNSDLDMPLKDSKQDDNFCIFITISFVRHCVLFYCSIFIFSFLKIIAKR